MPSNDDTHESGGRLDPFLIAGPTAVAPGVVAGLDDFLAAPPIPADPTAPEADGEDRAGSASHQLPAVADLAAIAATTARLGSDEALKAAETPIIASFPPTGAEPSAVAESLGELGPSLIAPPDVVFPSDADQGLSITSQAAAGMDGGRGGDALSALAANPLDESLLADPSSLLSTAPLASPAVADQQAVDRLDRWSSDSSWSGRTDAVARFGRGAAAAGPSGPGPLDSWGRGDDRSSGGTEALDRVEGRLSQAVAKLEEAVAALSAPGPAPLGSRPRGFRGRIDA